MPPARSVAVPAMATALSVPSVRHAPMSCCNMVGSMPSPGHGETGLQLHVHTVAVEREAHELQSHRTVRHRHETQLPSGECNSGWGTMGQFR